MRKRLTYEKVNEYIEKLGYKLINLEFTKSIDKLTLIDSEGYYYFTSYMRLEQKHLPQRFHTSNPYTIGNIILWYKLNNKPFELISDIYSGNSMNLQWKCLKEDCGEIFEKNWNHINSGQSCPFCAGYQVGLSNCLATKNPQVAKEWHPVNNGEITPYDVTTGSGKKIWWKCEKGHEWKAKISERCRKDGKASGCPSCNESKSEKKISSIFIKKGYKSINQKEYDDLLLKNQVFNQKYFIPQKSFKGLVGIKNGLLSYDFYVPTLNLLIEYQGEFHNGNVRNQSEQDLKRQQEHDRRKKEYARNNSFSLLEIWYWDFDNIEEILNDILRG